MKPRTLLLIGALGLLGCGDATPPQPADASAVVRTRAPLRAGDIHRYAFSWKVASQGDAAMVGGRSVGGDVELVGELAVTVRGEHEDGTLVGVRFSRLDEARLAILGKNVLPSAEMLLEDEALLVVPKDGRPRTLRFEPDAAPVFRKLMAGALAHVDLSLPQAGVEAFTEVGPTGNGLAKIDYARNSADPRSLTRTVAEYERVDALEGVPPSAGWSVDSEGRIELGSSALFDAIELSESLVLVNRENPISFGAETKFSMRRVGLEHAEAAPLPNLDDWLSVDLFEAPDGSEAEQEMARKFAEGLTLTDVGIVVNSARRGMAIPKGFLVRARGLLKGWPELATELRPLFENSEDIGTRELVTDLLVSADTPQAQEVLVDLFEDLAERSDPQLPALVQHLNLVHTPTPAVALLVMDLHQLGVTNDDENLRLGSLYAIGSIAAQIQRAEPELAEAMLATLRSELAESNTPIRTQAALAGLGNAGRPEDLERILGERHHTDHNVRAQVASSLRFIREPKATDALFHLLGDSSRTVAAISLSTIDFYRPDDVELHRLAASTINASVNPELTGPFVSVLAKRGLDDDLSAEAMAILYQRTSDPRQKVRIARILGLET